MARQLYCRFFTAAMRMLVPGTRGLVPRKLNRAAGAEPTLHVAAPGASVTRSNLAPASIEGDVLGVNYFALCRDSALWPRAKMFVIEPHRTYRDYTKALASVAEANGPIDVIVKGALSPSKLASASRLVRAAARVDGVSVKLAADMYLSDFPHASFAKAIAEHPQRTFCGSKSLLWTISFGVAAGYRRIVLHGFDFSKDYAYTASPPGVSRPRPNTWVTDDDTTQYVLDQVAELSTYLESRGVRLLQHECDGPLSTMLPAYAPTDLRREDPA